MDEARSVAGQPQVWNAYIPDGSKFVQKGQTSVSLWAQSECLLHCQVNYPVVKYIW